MSQIFSRNSKIAVYIRESIGELKKVSWPKKEEVINSTFVVIIFIIIMSLFLGIFDMGVGELVRYLFSSVG